MTPNPRAARAVAAALLFLFLLTGIAALGGGWLMLGRADPLLAVPGIGWAALIAAWAAGEGVGWRWGLGTAIAGIGALVLVVLLAGAALPAWPLLIAAGALVSGLLIATALAHRLRALWHAGGARRWSAALLTAVAGVGWQWLGWALVPLAYAIPAADRPAVALLTSLPLGDPSMDARLAGRARDAPALLVLRHATRLTQADAITPDLLDDSDVLLLAHPQQLPPAALVAIDDWVRGGGHAVVLADGLSSWHPRYPLGDPRNPPVTSMLTPLLTHWGLTLDAPDGLIAQEVRMAAGEGRLRLFSPGRLSGAGAGCAIDSSGIIGDCRIGEGRALIVADADLLDAELWMGAGASLHSTGWSAGNMLWLLDSIAPDRSRSLASPIWRD